MYASNRLYNPFTHPSSHKATSTGSIRPVIRISAKTREMGTDRSSDSEAGATSLAKDQKIRDSCNACSSHKIRCTKERPVCKRCATKGLRCEYSISRRNGKRQRSCDPTSDPTSIPAFAPSPALTPSAFLIGDDFDSLCDMYSSGNQVDHATSSDDSWIMDATPATSADVSIQHYFEPQSIRDFEGAVGIVNDADDVLSAGIGPKDVDSCFESGGSMPMVQQPSTDSFAALFPHTHEFRAGGSRGMMPPVKQSPTLLRHDSFSSMPIKQPARGHDCLQLALRIVTEMHVATQTCSVLDAASTHCIISSRGDTPRDMNTVLQVNRDAIRLLNNILDCPSCSGDHMCLMATHLAAQKTVAWYAAIVALDSGEPGGGNGLADLISARPIYMGSFALDKKAQRLVRASVIVTELRDHVQPLATRLEKLLQPERGLSLSLPSPESFEIEPRSAPDKHPHGLSEQIVRIIARASPSRS